ncbi:MAG TPA: response regulator transcription factor [Anaerolineales bacterium]
MPIKILIADDHGVIRAGLRALLSGLPELEVVGEAVDGRDTLRKAMELKPSIVIMDLSMPEMGGVETTRQLSQITPDIRVLILTVHEDESLLKEVIRAGAAGYIIKRAVEDELIHAIRVVARGDMYVHPSMTRALFSAPPASKESEATEVETLTAREIEVLRLLVKGYTNRQIAEQLSISPRTAEGHRANLSGKLGLHSRVELVEYAQQHGLLKHNHQENN